MDTQEYQAWNKFMQASKGFWTVDPIHNGVDRDDLILFKCSPNDETRGVYITIEDRTVTSGRFEDGYPFLTDGVFDICWAASFPKGRDDAIAFVLESFGLNVLLAMTHGRSPYSGV